MEPIKSNYASDDEGQGSLPPDVPPTPSREESEEAEEEDEQERQFMDHLGHEMDDLHRELENFDHLLSMESTLEDFDTFFHNHPTPPSSEDTEDEEDEEQEDSDFFGHDNFGFPDGGEEDWLDLVDDEDLPDEEPHGPVDPDFEDLDEEPDDLAARLAEMISNSDAQKHTASRASKAAENPLWTSHLSQRAIASDSYRRDVEEVGLDLQGVKWGDSRIAHPSRRQFREHRTRSYDNYQNCEFDGRKVLKMCDKVMNCGSEDFYERSSSIAIYKNVYTTLDAREEDPRWLFHPRLFTGLINPFRNHFQLRHLLVAISPSDVLYVSGPSEVKMWSSPVSTDNGEPGTDTSILLLVGTGSMEQREMERIKIIAMDANEEILAIGGHDGELAIMNMSHKGHVAYRTQLSQEKLFNNSVHIEGNSVLCASNDKSVRLFDLDACVTSTVLQFDVCANRAIGNPHNPRLIAVGLDSEKVQLCDARARGTTGELIGHKDFVFGLDWHPNGIHLATGAQDKTARIWDIRMVGSGLSSSSSSASPTSPSAKRKFQSISLSDSQDVLPDDFMSENEAVDDDDSGDDYSHSAAQLHCLPARMASVHSVRYSPDGRFLMAAEASDFVHVYKVGAGHNMYRKRQTVADVFGDIAGTSWIPDGSERAYIGVHENQIHGILEVESNCFDSLDLM